MASAEAWVYSVQHAQKPWGTFVDERIRYKTLFEPGADLHENFDEIIIPLEGRYWVKSGNWSRTLVPGEATFIPRNTPHDSGKASNLVGTHFLVLLFNPELNVLKPSDVGGILLPAGTLSWLKGVFRFLRNSPNSAGMHALLSFPEFFRSLDKTAKLPADESHPDPVVAQIIKLLEVTDTPSLEEMAIEVGLSPFHLQKRFKLALGFSPLQYANAWKIDLIADELKKGNTLSLVDLATEFGFNDQKHFRDLFQRRFGVAPSAYRKNPPPQKSKSK